MKNIFKKGQLEYPYEYPNLYGIYKSMVSDENDTYCYEKSKITFLFDATQIVHNRIDNYLQEYYGVHYNNLNLLKEKIDVENNLRINISNLYKIIKVYTKIDEVVDKLHNERMRLYFSDEKLFTFYILEEQKEMHYLAKNTLSLCDKYEHFSGVKLREFLVREDICFNGEDLNRVYEFAQNYIWL